jgi:teichuronic acid biosynthesis glycosyltransferase TuaC
MRVLVFTNMYPFPALPFYGSFVQDEVNALERAGLDVDVYFVNGKSSKLQYFGAPFGLVKRLRSRKYDIIHVHHSFCAFFATMQNTIPVVWTFHEGEITSEESIIRSDSPVKRLAYSKGFKRRMAGRVDAAIVVSDHLKEPIGRPDAETIPCGIDMALFKPLDRLVAREQLGISPDSICVLFPSEPERMGKRFELASAGVELLGKRRETPVKLLCLDKVPHEQVPVHMNACDVFLMTSAFEASPVTVREALSCNLPVVSTAVGDVESVVEGIDGCYIIEPNANDIANKLDLALGRPRPFEGREKMRRYSIETTVQKLVELYQRLIASRTEI